MCGDHTVVHSAVEKKSFMPQCCHIIISKLQRLRTERKIIKRTQFVTNVLKFHCFSVLVAHSRQFFFICHRSFTYFGYCYFIHNKITIHCAKYANTDRRIRRKHFFFFFGGAFDITDSDRKTNCIYNEKRVWGEQKSK